MNQISTNLRGSSLRKALFLSMILMKITSCYAQDVSALFAFRDMIRKSTDEEITIYVKIGKHKQLNEIRDDCCLYDLSL